MSSDIWTIENLRSEAAIALRDGRADEVRASLESAIRAGHANERDWLALASLQRAQKDSRAEEATLAGLLERRPRSIAGHILKAECRAKVGDGDAARLFYARALSLDEQQRGPLAPTDDGHDIAQARKALADLQDRAYADRERRLSSRGLAPDTWSPRFRHAIELAAGRRKLYAQEPTAFTYPGLPHVQFFDPAAFSWAADIEAAAPAIRNELLALLAGGGDEAFRPYIQSTVGSTPLGGNQTLLNNRDWSVLSLCENGWLTPDLVARCPITWQAMLGAPIPRIAGWGPTVVFSMLKSGARIAAHTGMFNTRLICHLPLIVPPGCRFRVGDEVREWEEGKLMIFDDTIEHEAWNDGPEDRVVLIFDVWRPELSEQERLELTAMFSD